MGNALGEAGRLWDRAGPSAAPALNAVAVRTFIGPQDSPCNRTGVTLKRRRATEKNASSFQLPLFDSTLAVSIKPVGQQCLSFSPPAAQGDPPKRLRAMARARARERMGRGRGRRRR